MTEHTLLNVCGGIALGAVTLFVLAWLIVLMIWIANLVRPTELSDEKADRRLALQDRIEPPAPMRLAFPLGGAVGLAIVILTGLPFMIATWIAGAFDGDFENALAATEQIFYVGVIVAVSAAILMWGFTLGWVTLAVAVGATMKPREDEAAYNRRYQRAAAEAARKRREEEVQRRLAARPRLFRRRQKAIAE